MYEDVGYTLTSTPDLGSVMTVRRSGKKFFIETTDDSKVGTYDISVLPFTNS